MKNSTQTSGELLKATVSNLYVRFMRASCKYWGEMLVQALDYYATLQESVNIKISILKEGTVSQ